MISSNSPVDRELDTFSVFVIKINMPLRRKMPRILSVNVPIRRETIDFIDNEFGQGVTIKYKNRNLKKDLLVYLIYYVSNHALKYQKRGNAFPLNSTILRENFISDYKKYLVFLEDKNILMKVRNQDTYLGLSSLFKLNFISHSTSRELIYYRLTDINILQKINYEGKGLTSRNLEKNKRAKKLRPHLIKSFNDHLKIDVKGAKEEISNYDNLKYYSNFLTISKYENKQWAYSIKPETDNRLHTTLTRTKKNLLKYLTYKNEKLGEIDIKTSQPLFLYAILKALHIDHEKQCKLYKYLTDILDPKLLLILKNTKVNYDEIQLFGKVILEEDLYVYLANNSIPKLVIEQKHSRYDAKKRRQVYYDNGRDFIKNSVMRSLYKGRGKELKNVTEQFKTIFKIVKIFNKHKHGGTTKAYLSKVLQNVEAHILLDLIAKDIESEFRGIPIFSKHDSIITYAKSLDEVQLFMNNKFAHYTGLEGDFFKTEKW